MSNQITIDNRPSAQELWAGIGGHFDNLGQIINEFIDNSVSNFVGNNTETRNINITLKELTTNGNVRVSIEDTGTGIKNINEAFTLGCIAAGESPLNEHGFGLKHALASANPANDSWVIFTRTKENLDNNCYVKIAAPYEIENFCGTIISDNPWPGKLHGTGTLIEFVCTRDMYLTITRGIKGGVTLFKTVADILCEDIGFFYAGIITKAEANITLHIIDSAGNSINRVVGAVEPDWDDYIRPGSGTQRVDLGGGDVDIEYKFGKINQKAPREEFNNKTTRKYYQKNMSSSGVELRFNGRVICYNLFKEIWGIEKHNSYNYLLITLDLKSDNKNALPQTRTSKNGLREGDSKLESLYSWIRSNLNQPAKDVSLSDHETDLFEQLQQNMLQYNPDPNKVIETEMHVFTSTGDKRDKVRIDLYEKTSYGITIYEGKKENTSSKDVYQLRMYWDGLVYDGIKPDKGILVASEHPDSVKNLLQIVNTMCDTNGNNYNFEAKTWNDLGIILN
jgi:hypothetical protein